MGFAQQLSVVDSEGNPLTSVNVYYRYGDSYTAITLDDNGVGSIPDKWDDIAIEVEGTYLSISEKVDIVTVVDNEGNAYEFATIRLYKFRANNPNGYRFACQYQYNYAGMTTDFMLEANKDYYLPYGTYYFNETRYSLYQDLTIDVAVRRTLTVNVTDTEGKPADDVYVDVSTPSGARKECEKPENGKLTYSLEEGQYDIVVRPWTREYSFESKTINLNQDMTLSFTVPKKNSFSVTIDGISAIKYFGGTESFGDKDPAISFYSSDYRLFRGVSFVDGKFVGRFSPDESFRIAAYNFRRQEYDDNGFVKGTTKITDGATIRIGTFNVQSEGEGLTFPEKSSPATVLIRSSSAILSVWLPCHSEIRSLLAGISTVRSTPTR